jgi:hypothetical protein
MKLTLIAAAAIAALFTAPVAAADPPPPPAQICEGLDYIYGDQTGVTDPELINEAKQNVTDRAVIDAQTLVTNGMAPAAAGQTVIDAIQSTCPHYSYAIPAVQGESF